jgi:hypothetical protein
VLPLPPYDVGHIHQTPTIYRLSHNRLIRGVRQANNVQEALLDGVLTVSIQGRCDGHVLIENVPRLPAFVNQRHVIWDSR